MLSNSNFSINVPMEISNSQIKLFRWWTKWYDIFNNKISPSTNFNIMNYIGYIDLKITPTKKWVSAAIFHIYGILQTAWMISNEQNNAVL